MKPSLAKHLKTFSINYTSSVDGRVYSGDFTVKKLNIRDLSKLGVRKAQLNGGYHYDAAKPGMGIDPLTDDMNNIIAHLELAIVQAPVWWNLEEITDTSIIAQVYSEVNSFENSFSGSLGPVAHSTGSSEAGSEAQE